MNEGMQNEFDVRYYKWARGDMQREISQGFPLLPTIRGAEALGAKDYLQSLSKTGRERLGCALVKRAHPTATALLEDQLNAGENALLRRYLDSVTEFVQRHRQKEVLRRSEMKARTGDVDKRRLRTLIKNNLTGVCGEVSVNYAGYEWVHSTSCGVWQIDTYLDMGGSTFQLRYWHEIVSSEKETSKLKQNISFSLWLGIFPTQWDLLLRGDEEAAASSLQGVCAHFMQAAPGLLAGLGP